MTTKRNTKTTTRKATKRTAKKSSRKAPAKRRTPAKRTTKKSAKAPAKKSAPKTAAAAFTQRQLTNAAKGLTPPQREKLYKDLVGRDVPRNRKGVATFTTAKLSGIIAKSIIKSGTVPAVVAKALRPKRSSGPRELVPKRIDCVVRMLRQKKGATADEIAKQLAKEFPQRRNGSRANESWYRSYVLNCIRGLGLGTVKRFPTKGKVKEVSDGRYHCTVAA